MFNSIKNTKKGFTLIELLVVIAIIGILSSVVLASLSTARQKSRDAKRISDVGQIQLALELYFDAYQSYPSTTPVASTATIEGAVQTLANASMIPKAPTPPNGGKYLYRGVTAAGAECLAAPCTSYAIAVTLERTDNTVLTTDADQTGTAGGAFNAWGGYAATPAAGAAGGKIFGESQDCTAAAATAELCYDIKP